MSTLSNSDNYSFSLVNRLSIDFSENYGEKDFFEAAGDFSLYLARKSFGVEVVSNYQNKVQAEKIGYSIVHIFLFLLTLPLSSIVSLAGVGLISLSNTHRDKFNQLRNGGQTPSVILGSEGGSHPNSVSPNNPLPLSIEQSAEQLSSAQFLDEVWRRYKNLYKDKDSPLFSEILNSLKMEFSPGMYASVWPDICKLSNPVLDCQDDDEVYFIPTNSFNVTSCSQIDLNPEKGEHLTFLIKTLSAAFETGKKIVVVRLAGSTHSVAAGFSADGQFKIIDSEFDSTVDIGLLTEKLNQAQLKNREGNSIHFSGEYVNTHIQQGGHECIRFATLYCYHMYKTKDLDAYKEVNGAFSEGKLKRFEDYKKINESTKIPSFKGGSKELYVKFMQSWAYRTQGFAVDTWEGIKPAVDLLLDQEKLGVYFLGDHFAFPPCYQYSEKLFIVDKNQSEHTINTLNDLPKEQEIPLNTDNSVTLGLLNPKKERRLLIFEKGNNQPRLYRLFPQQRIFYSCDGDTKRISLGK